MWLAVDITGKEFLFTFEPSKFEDKWVIFSNYYNIHTEKDEKIAIESGIELPKGSIFKLKGVKLNWEDEPIEFI